MFPSQKEKQVWKFQDKGLLEHGSRKGLLRIKIVLKDCLCFHEIFASKGLKLKVLQVKFLTVAMPRVLIQHLKGCRAEAGLAQW